MQSRLLRTFLVMAVAAAGAAARADESNFRPYHVGSRAAGMGGAFTALADDGSGAWYNPGGLAFVQRSDLSIAGSVYGWVSGSFQDALGDGHDFKYAGLNTFPTATAAIWRLGEPGAAEAHVLSLSVFVPDAISIDDRDSLGSRQNAFFFSDQMQTVWAGLGWARRFGRVGVGVGAFALLGTHVAQTDLTAVSAADPSQFATISGRTDETMYGVAGSAGLRWDPSDDLHLGISVYSPAIGTGKRRSFTKLLVGNVAGGPVAAVVNADDLTATPWQPLRVQGGVAASFGALTLAADVQFLGPREVWNDSGRAAEGLDKRVTRNAVVNGSVGVEYVVARRYPLRAGFFTDFSASPAPVAYSTGGADPNPSNTSHVNRFGGTVSVGVRTDHSSTDFGLCVSGGSGTDLVPNNLDFTNLKPTTATQLMVYAFLGTSYQF
jgi:hypothetical protein